MKRRNWCFANNIQDVFNLPLLTVTALKGMRLKVVSVEERKWMSHLVKGTNNKSVSSRKKGERYRDFLCAWLFFCDDYGNGLFHAFNGIMGLQGIEWWLFLVFNAWIVLCMNKKATSVLLPVFQLKPPLYCSFYGKDAMHGVRFKIQGFLNVLGKI